MLCVVLCVALLRGLPWNPRSFGLSKYRMSDEHHEQTGFKNCGHRLCNMYANPLKSDSGRVRAARLQPQRPFRKTHIPEAPKFASRFAEHRNLLESESL